MFKSKKFIIITLALVGVILIGATAGIALAQNQDQAQTNGRQQLMARVAEILGVDQQKLEDAFQQAMKEQREQRLDAYLQKLVDDGKLTADQAAQYKEWLKSKPDIPFPKSDRFPGKRGFMPHEMPRYGELSTPETT